MNLKKTLSLVFLALLLPFFFNSCNTVPPTGKDYQISTASGLERASKSFILILGVKEGTEEQTQGSGFPLKRYSKDGKTGTYVFTAAHICIESYQGYRLIITDDAERAFEGEVHTLDILNDICVLKVDDFLTYHLAELASAKPKVGDEV
jgi:S1-C subfamily serine protease